MNTTTNTAANENKTFGIVAERDALKAENEEMRAMIADLKRYLTSSKFHDDKTVQVRDVLNRIGA